MTSPTPLQSLEVLEKVVEATPTNGQERDILRFHAQNVRQALQPEKPVDIGGATPE